MRNIKTVSAILVLALLATGFPLDSTTAKETCSWVTHGGNACHNGITKNECLPSDDISLLFSKEHEDKIVCAPVFLDNNVFYPTKEGKLLCIDSKTNELVWENSDPSSRVEFPPFISGEYLYQVSYKDIFKIETKTGKTIKEYKSDSRITTPVVGSDNLLIFGGKDGNLVCLDEKNLDEKWKFETGKSIESIPAIYDDKIFVASNDKKLYSLGLKSGKKIWDFVLEKAPVVPVVVADKKVYTASGSSLFGFNLDGTPRWKFATYSDITSIAANDKHVFCTTTNFKLQCIDATFCGDTCCIKPAKELWFTNIPKGKMEIETITDKSVIVSCESDDLVCVDVTDGNSFWKKGFDNDLDKTIIVDGRIFIADDTHFRIYANSPNVLRYKIGERDYGRDDYKITMDTKPIILHDRTFLPARFVVEPLGGEIGWDGITKEIKVTYKDTEITMNIGNPEAKVNGKTVAISDDNKVAPVIVDDRTLIPLRFIAENMNCVVGYEASTKMITLTNVKDK